MTCSKNRVINHQDFALSFYFAQQENKKPKRQYYNSKMQSFISGQPSVQGEEGDGLPQQSNELVEFGWNMIKVNSQPGSAVSLSILVNSSLSHLAL